MVIEHGLIQTVGARGHRGVGGALHKKSVLHKYAGGCTRNRPATVKVTGREKPHPIALGLRGRWLGTDDMKLAYAVSAEDTHLQRARVVLVAPEWMAQFLRLGQRGLLFQLFSRVAIPPPAQLRLLR